METEDRGSQGSAVVIVGASPLASPATPTGDQRLDLTLEGAIAGWLHQNGYKATRKASSRTGWEYATDLIGPHGYRVACQRRGLDLDSPDTRALRLIAQEWAATPKMSGKGIGRPVAHATHNRRLASVSSFYRYARSNDLPKAGRSAEDVVSNPIENVKRQRTQRYAGAQPLTVRTS